MLVTEESYNEIMRMNAASMICDRKNDFRFKSFVEEFIKFFSYENRDMG